jgi:hypothetical protein
VKLERALAPLWIVACVAVLAAATRAQDGNDGVRRLDELWNTQAKTRHPARRHLWSRARRGDPKTSKWRGVWRATRWLTIKKADDTENGAYHRHERNAPRPAPGSRRRPFTNDGGGEYGNPASRALCNEGIAAGSSTRD